MAILTLYSRLADQSSSSPSSDSINTSRKMTYGNSCKKKSAIQRSEQKLWPFLLVTQVWLTRAPCHGVAISNLPQEKRHPETLVET